MLALVAGACGGGGSSGSTDTTKAAAALEARASGGSGDAVRSGAPTVVFVGTSLTAGLGLDPDSAYPALVDRRADSAGLPIEVVNAGLSGETSAGALRRIDWLLTGPGDVVVIETGANDGLRGLNVDSTRANISAILRKVKAAKPEATLLLMQMEAPPNLGASYTGAFRAMFPALAREHGATLVPFLLEGVAGKASLNQPDGIHPNEQGERIVAANVWRSLEPVLRQVMAARAAAD